MTISFSRTLLHGGTESVSHFSRLFKTAIRFHMFWWETKPDSTIYLVFDYMYCVVQYGPLKMRCEGRKNSVKGLNINDDVW